MTPEIKLYHLAGEVLQELIRGNRNLTETQKKLCNALADVRNPLCPYCGGTGQYFDHAWNCKSDFCALAGGPDDCDGQVMECTCHPSPVTIG